MSLLSYKLRLNSVKTELFKGTISNNRIPYLWNILPENLRTEDLRLTCFKEMQEIYQE